jgi:hypothetical protein
MATIRRFPEVDQLLEGFILRAGLLPRNAQRVRIAGAVPNGLRSLVMQAVKRRRTWSCWIEGTRAWLFTAGVSLPLSRECGAPVFCIKVYGGDGILQGSGGWIKEGDGSWTRCAD